MIKNFKIDQCQLGPMDNYIYFLQNTQTKKVFIVDPAWDSNFILNHIRKKKLFPQGILVTHFHRDHTNGIEDILQKYDIPVYVSEKEDSFYSNISENISPVSASEKIQLDCIDIECLHTPGHSPGSQCFRVGDSLISGDTLFLDGCGRCDLPGGSVEDMYHSIQNIILRLPDSTTLYPGHNYHHLKKDTLKEQKKTNPYLQSHHLKDFVAKRLPS